MVVKSWTDKAQHTRGLGSFSVESRQSAREENHQQAEHHACTTSDSEQSNEGLTASENNASQQGYDSYDEYPQPER